MKEYKKKIADRYDISGLVEAQFEPGSRRRVLKNLLGVKSKREMDRLEGLGLGNDFSNSSQSKWTPSIAVEEATVLGSSVSLRFESLR